MTGKERMTRACLGLDVDRVPWAPMLYQWFNANLYTGGLPPELSGCRTTLDALRAMEADVLAKHEAFVVHAAYSECAFSASFEGNELKLPVVRTCMMDMFGPHGNIDFLGRAERVDSLTTPKGTLTARWVYDEFAGAPCEVKNFWTDFESDYSAVRALLEDVEFIIDAPRWEGVLAELGEDGIAHFRIPPSPLKMLHWLAGPERTVYFMVDHPNEIMELVVIYERKRLELVKKAASFPDSLVFVSGDNMDSMMYSPSIFQCFCGHSFQQVAEILHENGKLLFTHACGRLSRIIKLCQDSGVDGIEGMAPPPLGDLGFDDARELLGPSFVLQGGMTCVEEELDGTDSRERIFHRVAELFADLPDKKAFIFGSGCCPGPRAKHDNLIALRDACWKYGGL